MTICRLSRHPQVVFKTSSKYLQDILKTSSGRLQDIFKASSKRVQEVSENEKTYALGDKKLLHWRTLQDVFKLSLLGKWLAVNYFE